MNLYKATIRKQCFLHVAFKDRLQASLKDQVESINACNAMQCITQVIHYLYVFQTYIFLHRVASTTVSLAVHESVYIIIL